MVFIKKLSIANHQSFLKGLAIFFVVLFLTAAKADAASLSVSPSSGYLTVGKSITVRVVVGSGGQSVNAIAGQLHFSNDLLTLVGLSKGCLVNLWAQEPVYSNAAGSVSFQGVILNGYTGGAGTVVTLTFRAKAAGTASISISGSTSSVLLNDGQGTNVLSSTSGATVSIAKPAAPAPVVQPTPQPEPVVIPTPTVVATPPVVIPPAPVVVVPLIAPLFTDYQSPAELGNFVVVKGTASPNSTITITFTHIDSNGQTTVSQQDVITNNAGVFSYVSDQKVTEGSSYTIVASTTDGQHTAPLQLSVRNSIWFVITTWIASIIAIKISIVFALLILIVIVEYLLYRNRILKQHLQQAIDQLHQQNTIINK
jgi:hypothetical protein